MNGRDANADAPYAAFGLDIETTARGTTVIPHGELEALSAPVFAAVLDAVAARAPRLVVIDLGDVRFCSVAALRAMAELAARLQATDGRVRIVAPAVLDRMLEVADLRSMFELDDHRLPQCDADSVRQLVPRAVNAGRSARPRTTSPRRLATGT